MMRKIFEIDNLMELRDYLSARPDIDQFREQLYDEFLRYSCYRNAGEWNAAVRICEALAIIGWGKHEPLEAIKGICFNGNPETYFINSSSKPRFLNAVWSKRKNRVAIDYEYSFLYGGFDKLLTEPIRLNGESGEPQTIPLRSQRNWIPKNPIRIIRGIANCYETSKPLIESVEKKLIPLLNNGMRPELYGDAIDSIILNLSFSFYDNYHCKTNYIIADESLKLKKKEYYSKLLEMYSEKEIEENGYYLRNRFTYGPFRSDTGTVSVKIVFEREFSRLSIPEQTYLFSEYLIHAVEHVARRLERKIHYGFPLLICDLKSIMDSWCNNCLSSWSN